MRHIATLAVAAVLLALGAVLVLTAPAGAHVVDGTYRSDVTAANCGSYDACGSGQSGSSSDSTSSSSSGELDSIAQCESGGDPSTNTGNGYTGKFQFLDSTWKAAGGSTSSAYQASEAEQDQVAASWIAAGHREAWPNC
jgi:hypothetical protein